MTPDFERHLIDFLFSGLEGIANDFNIYAPPRPPGPEPVLNTVSIAQDLERVLGRPALERLAARARAERRLWFDPPEIKIEPPPFRFSVAVPAPIWCRIILTVPA